MGSEAILRQLERFFDENRISNCLQTYDADSVFMAWMRHVKAGNEEDLFGLLGLLIDFRNEDLETFVRSQGIPIENTDSDWLRMRKLLNALKVRAFVPEVKGLYAVRDELRSKVDQYERQLDRSQRKATEILRVNEGFFYWPQCEEILRKVFAFYNAVIYQFLDISDDLRDKVERELEADSLGAMLRGMAELNKLLDVPDVDSGGATEDEKRLNESRRQFRRQFESTFGRASFSGGITNEELSAYVKMYDEYRSKPAHGRVERKVTLRWALEAMKSLLEIVDALIREQVYPGIKVPFAFEIDAWGRESVVFWEEPNIGKEDPDFYERFPYSAEPEILYRPCMGCEFRVSSGLERPPIPDSARMYEELSVPALEKETLVYGQSEWVFWTLDQLDAMHGQRVESSDVQWAIRQADETISYDGRNDPDAVLAEVESHLRKRFRKRVVDRFFNREGNAQAIEASRNKVLKLWKQMQERKECLTRITDLICLIALRKARTVSDHVLLRDLRGLMRKACGNPGPCNRCDTRDVCRWVNSLAADVVSGEQYV